MPKVRQHPLASLLALMDDWPESWEGVAADIPVGRQLVDLFRPFMTDLAQRNLSPKTMRRHLDNLWLIGGEVVRKLDSDPSLRKKPARDLLGDAVVGGEAPLVRGLTEAEQKTVDATAKKLERFLSGAG